jgi:photosystem II stability/assembly factor-like uncharacterized protein
MPEQLEQLYQEARSALMAKDYVRSGELLRQILQIDENYKDASRLLAQTVKLRRRRWYNHPALWIMLGVATIVALGIWLMPKIGGLFAKPESIAPTITVHPTSIVLPTDTPSPTETVVPTPTSIPLAWKRVYIGQEFDRDKIIAFELDPKDPDVLYVSMENAGYYQSIDGGISWQPSQNAQFPPAIRSALSINRNHNNDRDYSVTHTGPDGLERHYGTEKIGVNWSISEDGGKTWREFGMIGLPPSNAITFDSLGSLYVYCNLHVCKYSPDGKQRATLGMPDVGAFTIIKISPFDPNTIYVAGKGIAISKDGGLTWSKLNNGLGSEILQLDAGKGSDTVLYVQSGICADEIRNKIRDYYGQPLYRSMDGGRTWTLSIEAGCQLVKDADGATLYRIGREPGGVSRGWIWRSSDEGKSWKKIFTPEPVIALAAHPTRSGELGIYTEFNAGLRVFASNDYGLNWDRQTLLNTGLCYGVGVGNLYNYRQTPISISRDPRDIDHILYVINGEIFESTDNCFNSKRLSLNIRSVNSIAFDSNNPKTLYAGTDGGAYVSFDGGQTWGQINNGLLGATVVYSIVVDKDGNVYAATPYGIFKLEEK